MLFLIDEIFHGTNSEDRIIGARNVLQSLSKNWVIGLISTHDFELCEFEKEGNANIKNYHFTESYSNNKIKFDYKIRSGRCKTTNAKYLMEMVGIVVAE
jgi:DNA mismatch repair ATPase MutS